MGGVDGGLYQRQKVGEFERANITPEQWRRIRQQFFVSNVSEQVKDTSVHRIVADVNDILYKELTTEDIRMCAFLTESVENNKLQLVNYRAFDSLE